MDVLKQRLEEYERRGVAASLEMQMAARAVNAENRRLRALLGILGASSKDVSTFLASFDRRDHGEPATYVESCDGAGSVMTSNSPSPPNPRKLRTRTIEPPLWPAPSSVATQSDDAAVTTIPTYLESTDMAITEIEECGQVSPVTSSLILSEISDCFCPREPLASHASPVDLSETSCDVAAAILLELHNHNDTAEVRIALGCTGKSDCSVKNTKIFQLIDSGL